MEKVFVCAGMNFGKNKKFEKEAKKLGELLAKNNYVYVQGGYADGLMGTTLKEFLKYSKNTELYLPDTYYDVDVPKIIQEIGDIGVKIHKTRGEADRLKKIQKCDEIVVLPGGTGTLEELLYCNETSRATEHKNNIYLVNISGFYNGFLKQIKVNMKEGMTKTGAIKFTVVKSVNDLPFLKI